MYFVTYTGYITNRPLSSIVYNVLLCNVLTYGGELRGRRSGGCVFPVWWYSS
jgi:hypothetical protein